jgi:hypothetical protein
LTSGESEAVRFAGHEARLLRRRNVVRGLAADLRRRLVDLVNVRLEVIVGERDRLRVEGVGLDDVGARFEVLAMHFVEHRRAGDGEDVAGALQVARMRREPVAAELALRESVALDHRPHRPVQDENAPGEKVAKLFGAIRLRHRCLQKTKSPAKCGASGRQIYVSTSGSLAFFNLVASGPKSTQVPRTISCAS